MPNKQKPDVSTLGEPYNGQRLKHPAYGKINVSKPQASSGVELFGSDLKHSHYVQVEIQTAHLDRHLNRDWIHGEDTVLRFAMSEAQWSSFVSSQGIGEGTPITFEIRPVDGSKFTICPEIQSLESTRETFDREMRETTAAFQERAMVLVRQLAAAVKDGKAGKGQLQDFHRQAESLANSLPNTVTFVNKQFTETMERAIESGKAEMENFVAAIAMRTGFEQIRQEGAALLANKTAPSVGRAPIGSITLEVDGVDQGDDSQTYIDPLSR